MSRWAAIVGAPHATPGGAADAVDGVVPAWVVRPGGVGEVQACVREAAATGAALVASGAGAHLDIGAPPRRLDVLLRLDRLARVLDHQAADMTVTVEAGCTLVALAEVLAAADQWLPLDPPRPEATTVGGLLAANLSGPLRASQGTARDWLIGLRTVGADGAVTVSGGKVVKNVAGYDLPKLHVGALGTVGVIVEATFKVRPRPPYEEAVIVGCPTLASAADTALALRDLAVEPLWLELVGPEVFAADGLAENAVVVGFGGILEEVVHGRKRLLEEVGTRGLHALAIADGAALRARLGEFAVEPAAAVLRAATLPAAAGEVIEAARAHARTVNTAVRCRAHAASGVVRMAVVTRAAVAPLVRALRLDVEASGGSLVVERADAGVKAAVDVWGHPGPALDLMRRVKTAFDPAGLFSPGRFVGGL